MKIYISKSNQFYEVFFISFNNHFKYAMMYKNKSRYDKIIKFYTIIRNIHKYLQKIIICQYINII